MNIDKIHQRIQFAELVNHPAGQVGGGCEQFFDGVLLFLIDQGDSSLHKVHKGNQPLKPETVDQGHFMREAGIQRRCLRFFLPAPVRDIRNLNNFFPVVDIIQQGRAGADNGTAGGFHVFPFNAEYVCDIGLTAAAKVFCIYFGARHHQFAEGGHPEGLFIIEKGNHIFPGCDRGISNR